MDHKYIFLLFERERERDEHLVLKTKNQSKIVFLKDDFYAKNRLSQRRIYFSN